MKIKEEKTNIKSKKFSKGKKALSTVLALSLLATGGTSCFAAKPPESQQQSNGECDQNDENIDAIIKELTREYTKEEFAKLPRKTRERIKRFGQDYFEYLTVNKSINAMDKFQQKVLISTGVLFGISQIGKIISIIKNSYDAVKHSISDYFYRKNCKIIDVKVYEQVLEKIEKRLHSELVGQDEAIQRIITIMRGYFESVIEAKELGKKFEGGLLLYLTGMPATGKSTTMKIIEEEMGLTSYVGRMSDIVEDKGNKAETVATRLTKPTIEDTGKVKVSVDSPLVRQIKTGMPTLYCLDEVDKMRNLDSVLQKRNLRNEDGKIAGSSIDEMLRNFGDTGRINGIDVSGSILIATSNETPEQLSELESSLYNRYKGCHIHFKDFNKQDYTEIINRKVEKIKAYYKKVYNADIKLDKSLLEHYSEKFVNEKSGGRGTDTLMNKFRATLKSYVNSVKDIRDKTISLNYDNQANKMVVKDVK